MATERGGFCSDWASPVRVVARAIGPRMVTVAGEQAGGALTLLARAHGVAVEIGTALLKTADTAGRPTPRLVAVVPAAGTADPGATRAVPAILAWEGD